MNRLQFDFGDEAIPSDSLLTATSAPEIGSLAAILLLGSKTDEKGSDFQSDIFNDFEEMKMAGWTGLEPAASGVTGSPESITAVANPSQPVAIPGEHISPQVQESQPLAAFFKNFATRFATRHGATDGSLLSRSSPEFSSELLSVVQVAKALRVSRATVYLLIEHGRLAHFRVSNSIRIPQEAVVQLLREGSVA